MKNTIADNALSKKRGRVIIGLLGKRGHSVIVTVTASTAALQAKIFT